MMRTRLVLLGLVAACTPAWAQLETAAMLGTVRDASGAVVAGATVTLTNTETGLSTPARLTLRKASSFQPFESALI